MRRHQATHGERNFICPMCQRSFTRNDLLRRHLARHDMPTAPDPRRGRACDACHANKTKCDGGTKCTLCIKRGISCTYKHASKAGSSRSSRSPVEDPKRTASRPVPDVHEINTPSSITPPIALGTSQISPADEIKAAFKRISNDVRTGKIPVGEPTTVPAPDHPWIEANSREYFGRLHEAWPVLHAPSYTIGMEDSFVIATSVAMISCWLRSPDEYGEVVMELHETIMNTLSQWIDKRLIAKASLLRDAYYALAHFQAPTLFREELDLTMPATFSLWNAFGLDIFFQRLPFEPTDRSNFKITEICANPNTPAKSLLLLEDVHLALCGLSPAIWNHAQIVRRSAEAGRSTHNSTASLGWQLEAWKADVERIQHQCFQTFHGAGMGDFPFKAYIGDFDDKPPRAKAAAMVHVKCLASDCIMIYHLQSLQLYSDTRMINSVAKAHTSPILTDREPTVRPWLQKLHSQLSLWTKSPESRKAVLHALAVLLDCEAALESNSPQTQSIDPTAYLAISTSALVVWAWTLFSEGVCMCVPSLNHINIGVDPPDLQNTNTARLETWIQADGTAAVNNIPLCRCVINGWTARFNALLPLGKRRWGLCDEVAPILSSLGAGN
uniref:C2H2-type domain-containing protein n=1 Tax=Gibberella zeae (strain ATCC MYA-4620 / CBS 123657 / FGSC 9075 / NRRL 31084 / PH-1) TaxID=229533 RepID=A0A098DBM5_GIBZE